MKEISSEDIIRFINDHATASSLRRSLDIHPIVKSIDALSAIYECEGSSARPYRIHISIANKNVKVQCSCPYDYGGICKHAVASLENFALTLKTDEPLGSKINSKTSKVEKEKTTDVSNGIISYPIENNTVDVSFIKADLTKFKANYYMSRDAHIVYVKTGEIKTKISDWVSTCFQVFKADSENKVLNMQCSCIEKIYNSYCKHLPFVFEKMIKIFDPTFFGANYLENKIEVFLKDYGLDLNDNYKKYFEFSLNEKGFQAISLFPNLQKISMPFESSLSKELTLNLPNNNLKTKSVEYGEGFIFEFSNQNFKGFTIVTAKFNKDGTDLATHFKEITMYNIESTLHEYGEEVTNIILSVLSANSLLGNFYREKSADSLQKSIAAFTKIIPLIAGFPIYSHDRDTTYTRKNLETLTLGSEIPNLVFNFSEDRLFYYLQPTIKIGENIYKIDANEISITPLFIKRNNEIYPLNTAILSADLLHYCAISETKYIKKNALDFKEKILIPLSAKYQINTENFVKERGSKKKTTAQNPINLPKQVYIDDQNGMVYFKLAVQYPEKLLDIESNEMRIDINDKGKFTYHERDHEAENQFREQFRSYHPDFETQEGSFYLYPSQLMEDFWLLDVIEKAKESEIELLGLKNINTFKYNLNKPSVSVSVQSDLDWFDVKIDISFGDQKLGLKDLQKAFIKKSNFVTLSDGSIGILPQEWMRKFAGYFKAGEMKKDALQISNFQFGIIDELYQELNEKPDFLLQLYEKKKRIQNISNITSVVVPKGVKATLRDYQKEGLNWLNFLDEHQLGGCLADDMGLGKTLQIITFLQHLKMTRKPKDVSLIIAPTSLIFNWQNEINKFCPTLKLLNFTGANRNEQLGNFGNYDVIITTYGSVMNDIEDLKNIDFNYVILDESQAIKNPTSKRYKAVRLLKAYNRVVLTGTPIENNTFDLYAQFNFVNPGLLGNITHFKKEFSDSIDKEKDIQTSELLSRIINPFMLRRTKEHVAAELPEKIESILYCEMQKEQRSVYDAFKNQYRDFLMNKIDENGIGKSQMFILEGLTKLRQICNSPATLSDKEEYTEESIKLDMLIENITQKTGKHKILVFSSFVKMLELVKNKLDENKITYEYLDGKTKDRQSKVENFQNQKDIRVFLISMKAGGTGLNLTEADYVFIIDPWWNPAVENQAIDRCYRIGQKKQVMAYRMICKDTIEEKILNLQQKKKKIASSIISVDEESKAFNAQEVRDLFA